MKTRFNGQVVWITGASSGIGAALAREFVKNGAKVALSARRVDRLLELQSELGESAHVFPVDVRDKESVMRVADDIASQLVKIDVVVANAGYHVVGNLEDLSEDVWRNLFETNVFGVVWTCQAAIPYLKKTRGRLAIMSSVSGKIALGRTSAYSASKFALMGLANALYLELFKSGVSVTAVAPGVVESEIHTVDNLGHKKDLSQLRNRNFYFKWPTDKAAEVMVKAIHERRREVVITGHGKVAAFLTSHFPTLTYWGMAKVSAGNRSSSW